MSSYTRNCLVVRLGHGLGREQWIQCGSEGGLCGLGTWAKAG
jgi:hypothetical protein